MTRKIFLLGHSHISALHEASRRGTWEGELEFLLLNAEQYQPVMEGAALNPVILARLGAAQAALHVSLLGGNDHSMMAMLNDPERFDFVLPEAPDLPADTSARILPAGLLQMELARWIEPHLLALAAYRAAVPGRLVHVESPPPIPSAAHIAAYPGVFREKIAERGISPALLRYKMWRLHSALYRAACARLGVEFLPVPPEMQDVEGMLVEAAWPHDPTHGNAFYGRHVLAQLAA